MGIIVVHCITMFTEFVNDVMKRLTVYEFMKDSKAYYGSIKGKDYQGVWAEGKTKKECATTLREVLEEWLLIKIRRKKLLPTTRRYNINSLLQ